MLTESTQHFTDPRPRVLTWENTKLLVITPWALRITWLRVSMFRIHCLDSSLLISKFYVALRARHPPSRPRAMFSTLEGAGEVAGTCSTHLSSLISHHPASPGPSLSLHSVKTHLSGSSLSPEAPAVSPCTSHTPRLFLYTGECFLWTRCFLTQQGAIWTPHLPDGSFVPSQALRNTMLSRQR